jgi:hypothetical protein
MSEAVPEKRGDIPSFETTFAVPLSCEDCIKDVSTSLYKLDGMHHGIWYGML